MTYKLQIKTVLIPIKSFKNQSQRMNGKYDDAEWVMRRKKRPNCYMFGFIVYRFSSRLPSTENWNYIAKVRRKTEKRVPIDAV